MVEFPIVIRQNHDLSGFQWLSEAVSRELNSLVERTGNKRRTSETMEGKGLERRRSLLLLRVSLAEKLRLLLSQFPRKVVEHAQLIAVQIGNPELAQVPRLVLRLSKDLRPSVAPTMVQFVDFMLAF